MNAPDIDTATVSELVAYCRWNDPNGDYGDCEQGEWDDTFYRAFLVDLVIHWIVEN